MNFADRLARQISKVSLGGQGLAFASSSLGKCQTEVSVAKSRFLPHLGLNKETPGGRVRSAARGRVVSRRDSAACTTDTTVRRKPHNKISVFSCVACEGSVCVSGQTRARHCQETFHCKNQPSIKPETLADCAPSLMRLGLRRDTGFFGQLGAFRPMHFTLLRKEHTPCN